MHSTKEEILTYIVVVSVVFVVLAGIIVSFLFLYQKKKRNYKREIIMLKKMYNKEVLETKIEIQEKTLEHISKELHDNYGQVLTAVHMNLSTLPLNNIENLKEQVNDTKQLVKNLMHEIRELSVGLSADSVLKSGFYAALLNESERIKKSGLYRITIRKEGDEYRLFKENELILFRIFQESLSNIIRHSGASQIEIDVKYLPDKFSLRVSDNGKGFDTMSPRFKYGSGLKNIKYRCRIIEAEFSIESNRGTGTQLIVILLKNKC